MSDRDEAKRLMAEGRTAEAIRCYEKHLEQNDEDHEARLEYGLACLIAGHRERFIEVGMEYQPCMSPYTLQRLGGRIRTLWNEYSGSCARFAAASAIGASVVVACASAGCNDKPAPPTEQTTAQEVVGSPEPPPDTAPAPVPLVSQTAEPPVEAVAGTDGQTEDDDEPAAKDKKKIRKPPPKNFPKTKYVVLHIDDDDLKL